MRFSLAVLSLAVAPLAPALRGQDPASGTDRPDPASPRAAHVRLEDLAGALDAADADGSAWVEFLARSSLRCGVYRLAAGAVDRQRPHARDEVYHVVAGSAVLEVGGERHEATAGSVHFVAAGTRHRFVDVTEELTALVFFADSEATQGGMQAATMRPKAQMPYPETSLRGNARVFYWYGNGSAGQLAIDHGRPVWKPAYDAFLERPGGPRWRLGEKFWTSLDTNIPLTIGGVRVEPGQWYLVLQHRADHGLELVLLDPAAVRARRLDAYEAPKTDGGLVVPLRHERTRAATATRLRIDLVCREGQELGADGSGEGHAELVIQFGPHRLHADVVMHAGE
jgi:quercetin dioxygenase-like cupin family protein